MEVEGETGETEGGKMERNGGELLHKYRILLFYKLPKTTIVSIPSSRTSKE